LILPRNADPREWPAFPHDEIGQWALRIGNQAVQRPDRSLAPVAPATTVAWSPADISQRQAELAQMALALWPRRPF
jgi:hypothetical protein